MTADKPTALEALTAAMRDIKAVSKDDHNAAQNFKFRGIDAVVNAVGPKFREHAVLTVPNVLSIETADVTTSSGKGGAHVLVTVRYDFYGPAGDHIPATVVGEAIDYGDKAVSKAMSVAWRTCLIQLLCLPTGETDPDSQSYERAPIERIKVKKGQGQPPDDWATEPPPPPDPLRVLKDKVWAAANTIGIADKELLAADYAQYTQGMLLSDAKDFELQAYLTHLEAEAKKAEQTALAL